MFGSMVLTILCIVFRSTSEKRCTLRQKSATVPELVEGLPKAKRTTATLLQANQ